MNDGKPPRRGSWSQPLAHLVAASLKPAIAPHGFSEADLLLFWPEIVGERLAARCRPLQMKWPVRAPAQEAGEPATLVIQVEGAFALELQHESAVLVERINAHFGWRCVGRLALRQGPVPRPPARPQRPGAADPLALRDAQAITAAIEEAPLRDALVRLGGRVLSGKGR